MACTQPMQVWRHRDGGPVSFSFVEGMAAMELACGRCTGCRLHRAAQWSLRLQHEASLYDQSSFVTLTYDDEHIPPYGSLRYSDVQKFLRVLRKRIRPRRVRFFCAGEYGSKTARPHYHLLLFGVSFQRSRDWARRNPAARLPNSAELEELWPHGANYVGSVTAGSASYCARYCLAKVYGRVEGDAHYVVGVDAGTGEVHDRTPEFIRMSLRPGIGADWFRQFGSDVFPSDGVITRGGFKWRVPRYYERLYELEHAVELESVKIEREVRMSAPELVRERTPERRAVREEILRARVKSQDERRVL